MENGNLRRRLPPRTVRGVKTGGSCPLSSLRSEGRTPARSVTAVWWSGYRLGALSAAKRDFGERRVVPDKGGRSVVGGVAGVRAS